MEDNNTKKHLLTVRDKKQVIADGVDCVLGFDEGYVSFDTVAGRITVEGNDLRIDSLTKNDKTIIIVGDITGVYYSGDAGKRHRKTGFFK